MLWVLCEIAIAACDLAEVIGSAIALNLLFGIPLIWGVCITALDVLLVLLPAEQGLPLARGARHHAHRDDRRLLRLRDHLLAARTSAAVAGGLHARAEIVTNPEMLYIAIGILGATVMPHNLYLHSSIVQTRKVRATTRRQGARRSSSRLIDSTIALMFALFINAAILIVAAATFHSTRPPGGRRDPGRLQAADAAAGRAVASTLFALALLASGQNSTLTGTLAGQIVMEGFLNIRLRPWLRRLITRLIAIMPAVIVTALYGESGTAKLLILSQVILSLQLSFAVFPLVMFTSQRRWASS